MTPKPVILLLAVCATVLLEQGCAGPMRKEAVPPALTTQAVVPGLPDVRYRVGIDTDALRKDAIDSFWKEIAYLKASGHKGKLPPAVFLAVSGGGDDGAFSAGLLNGWTAAGDRPQFKLVTGVSTGALIAPFAFLGPSYDDRLKRFYTEVSPSDIEKKRSLIAALTSDALADNAPLRKLVEKEVDQGFLDAVAAEQEKGRMLLIATTDLDARQAVLWNMTKIAASGDPKALDLFRSIMIGSAAIPGAFPPMMIDVEVNGRTYQEMHVDGGTMAQVFVYPPSLHVKEAAEKHHVARERRAYVIRNARLDPEWAQVDRRTLSIGERAISSLIETQGIGDLYRIYLEAERDGVDFNLAFIPASFNAPHREEFDTDYMRALYRKGYELTANGYPWEKVPPGF
ncbi:MAG: patatin-like phospholipase family protein [Thiocapsa sp.]|jgi:predicted acylesterase/phospholipase RssA|nr:patatin-like phospholipase family protein [Thiocapsa sp.]MCG6984200.1 patatin-like phospholipase family protein [Thiocapsa sp.]